MSSRLSKAEMVLVTFLIPVYNPGSSGVAIIHLVFLRNLHVRRKESWTSRNGNVGCPGRIRHYGKVAYLSSMFYFLMVG